MKKKESKPVGRPAKYNSAEELQTAIEAYLTATEIAKRFPTVSGLAYALGFESRQSFYDYEKNSEFSYTAKRARLLIESEYENGLRSDRSATGCIFALKNFGWTDKSEVELNGAVSITGIEYIIPNEDKNKTDS